MNRRLLTPLGKKRMNSSLVFPLDTRKSKSKVSLAIGGTALGSPKTVPTAALHPQKKKKPIPPKQKAIAIRRVKKKKKPVPVASNGIFGKSLQFNTGEFVVNNVEPNVEEKIPMKKAETFVPNPHKYHNEENTKLVFGSDIVHNEEFPVEENSFIYSSPLNQSLQQDDMKGVTMDIEELILPPQDSPDNNHSKANYRYNNIDDEELIVNRYEIAANIIQREWRKFSSYKHQKKSLLKSKLQTLRERRLKNNSLIMKDGTLEEKRLVHKEKLKQLEEAETERKRIEEEERKRIEEERLQQDSEEEKERKRIEEERLQQEIKEKERKRIEEERLQQEVIEKERKRIEEEKLLQEEEEAKEVERKRLEKEKLQQQEEAKEVERKRFEKEKILQEVKEKERKRIEKEKNKKEKKEKLQQQQEKVKAEWQSYQDGENGEEIEEIVFDVDQEDFDIEQSFEQGSHSTLRNKRKKFAFLDESFEFKDNLESFENKTDEEIRIRLSQSLNFDLEEIPLKDKNEKNEKNEKNKKNDKKKQNKGRKKENPEKSNKVSTLLHFLNEIEEEKEEGNMDIGESLPVLTTNSINENGLNDLATDVYDNVKAKILSLEIEVEDKNKEIALFKETIQNQKAAQKNLKKQHVEDLKEQKEQQKKGFEEVINRHLTFIDRLIEDKKQLNQKCLDLSEEMKQHEVAQETKLQEIKTQFEAERNSLKEQWAAAEKRRREAWIEQKTKEIKEMTVKGLEPEVQKIIELNKKEIREIKSKQGEELKKHKEELMKTQEKLLLRQREKITADFKKDIENEKNLRQQETWQAQKNLQTELEIQARRMQADFEKERAELLAARRKEKDTLEKQLEKVREREQSFSKAVDDKIKEEREKLRRQKDNEIQQLRESMKIENQQWQKEITKKLSAEHDQRENELKERLQKERDDEIDMLISRMEEESSQEIATIREECDHTISSRVAKHHAEKVALQNSQRDWKQKYVDISKQLKRTEQKIKDLQHHINDSESSHINQKEEIAAIQHNYNQKEQELLQRTLQIDTDYKEKLDRLLQDNSNLEEAITHHKSMLKRLNAKYQQELNTVVKEKDDELNEIEGRVRQTIKKRDEIIRGLKNKLQGEEMKRKHFETQLEQQRRQILNQKD